MLFFPVTLASCISPSLISFSFAFRFPVINFENFCLAANRLGQVSPIFLSEGHILLKGLEVESRTPYIMQVFREKLHSIKSTGVS